MKDANIQDTNLTQIRHNEKNNRKVFFKRRKGCPLSIAGTPPVDYKNPEMLLKFVSEGGRILPSRITNICAKKQREVKLQIKRARLLALLPFVYQI
jgi:small subunit ribosomal protein S18